MDEEAFPRLCQAQIEGTATEEDRAQLRVLLDSSEAARRSYVEQMRMHALLTWQHGRASLVLPEIKAEPKILPFPRWRRLAAVAAVLLLAGLAGWWPRSSPQPGVSFEVVAASDVSFRVGERATRRSLEMERGSLRFRLDSGALVDVSGPAKLELVSPMRLRVLRGTVTADISEGEKGFVIETAQARVVDLGTRFGVSAESKTGTDVVVFEGKVEVFDPSGKASRERPKITLTEGEAVRVEPSNRSRRLQMVPLQPDARSVREGGPSEIVSNIEDNVTDAGFRGYYGLVRGFAEGARAYTTGHTRAWHPMPGEGFPKELEGAEGICTFGEDRGAANLQITLRVSRPCDLYVLADARMPAPGWLQRDFTDTGSRLRSGPWIPRGVALSDYARYYADATAYVPYTVWKKRIPAPGSVVLGSPMAGIGGKKPAMYGLAVKALRPIALPLAL